MSEDPQIAIPAVYMRGGTSRALMFHARDLPGGSLGARDSWPPIFAAALGSPDPADRQLDGLGGGFSSLSKIAVIAPSNDPDVDVEYLFGQVSVRGTTTSYRGNCGNISAAVGPFAVDEGLVKAHGEDAIVRIRHTMTGKLIHAHFPLCNGKAAVRGDLKIQGVAGSGAIVKLDFLDPGGAVTGKLQPTGSALDTLDVPGVGRLEVSIIDAANPLVFARAQDFGLVGDETPGQLAADPDLLERLEALRASAAVAAGLVANVQESYTVLPNLPLVALVSPCEKEEGDIRVRMISSGLPHKATPLTGAMCLAIGAQLPNTLIAEMASRSAVGSFRIAHPSGILPVEAEIRDGRAIRCSVYRTARRLMEGSVLIPRT